MHTSKGWKTVIRKTTANHQKMEGQTIRVGDKFDLGNGVFAKCPGSSGTPENDCRCRCYLEYELMTVEEFAKATGKTVEEVKKEFGIVDKKAEKSFTNDDESGIINNKDLSSYIGKKIKKTDNRSVREWYVANVANIPNQVDKTKSFEEQVHQAYDLRNKYKHEARVAMSDRKTAEKLERERPAKSFEELLQDKINRKNLSKQEALEDILKTASKSNADVNKKFDL